MLCCGCGGEGGEDLLGRKVRDGCHHQEKKKNQGPFDLCANFGTPYFLHLE